MKEPVVILGGGLAGSEAAWQLADRGIPVALYEMRPARATPAHKTAFLAELVCSNSLKSNAIGSASWLLKEELRQAGSLLLRLADECAVPSGMALSVDRLTFAQSVTAEIEKHPNIELRREEAAEIPRSGLCLVATGPLTSSALAGNLQSLTGSQNLAFYDAISPIVDADTLRMDQIFPASRYGKGGSQDYLNCYLNEQEYRAFYEALGAADTIKLHDFEELRYFEACLPIEELARRGRDTLRFGPMKPVGLIDPRTGRQPFAAVQLRKEDLRCSSFNLVGFQNHLKFPDQKRILRMIPGLEGAEFLRYGQIHRNTYINAPRLLASDLSLRAAPRIFIAGQLSGVEGYVECIATGLLAGISIAARVAEGPYVAPPRTTALGSLVRYVTQAESENYQPANMAFDLLPPLTDAPAHVLRNRGARREAQCRRALHDFTGWLGAVRGGAAAARAPLPIFGGPVRESASTNIPELTADN